MTERMWHVGLLIHVNGPGAADVDRLTAVLDAYADIESADPALLDCAWGSTACDDGTELLDVEVTVAANGEQAAWERATAAVRAAIHASGGVTSSWDTAGRAPTFTLAPDVRDVVPV